MVSGQNASTHPLRSSGVDALLTGSGIRAEQRETAFWFFFGSLSVGPAHLRSAWTLSWNLTHTKKMFLLCFSKWMLLSPFTSLYLKYLDCLCMVYNFLPLAIIYNCYTLHLAHALKQSCLPMPYLLWTCVERSDIFLFTPLKKIMRPWALRKFPSARQWLPQTTVAKLSAKTYW